MIETVKLSKSEWVSMASDVHLICFNEQIVPDFNNITFALLNVEDKKPQTYCTVRELDKESCYWQYGGSFPGTKGTTKTFSNMRRNIEKCLQEGYKRISFYVENDNMVMLKMALKHGFKIIGTRMFKGSVLVEFLYEAS